MLFALMAALGSLGFAASASKGVRCNTTARATTSTDAAAPQPPAAAFRPLPSNLFFSPQKSSPLFIQAADFADSFGRQHAVLDAGWLADVGAEAVLSELSGSLARAAPAVVDYYNQHGEEVGLPAPEGENSTFAIAERSRIKKCLEENVGGGARGVPVPSGSFVSCDAPNAPNANCYSSCGLPLRFYVALLAVYCVGLLYLFAILQIQKNGCRKQKKDYLRQTQTSMLFGPTLRPPLRPATHRPRLAKTTNLGCPVQQCCGSAPLAVATIQKQHLLQACFVISAILFKRLSLQMRTSPRRTCQRLRRTLTCK